MSIYRDMALKTLLLGTCLLTPVSVFAQAAADDSVDEVIVTGQRASDRASLLKKRDAASAVEVLSANDVGKLPDQNVADAVRRLSGVSVATDKGEGRYLIVRGIEPNLANVTINNQTASAPEPESRNVKLDDIPSALIGSITVVKSLTPDLDANAIAGQVDISTLSAFDRSKPILSARLGGATYDIVDRHGIDGDLSVGGRFGPDNQFGGILAVNYSKRPSYSEDAEGDSNDEFGGFTLPLEFSQKVYDPAYRTRSGAVANFDWRPNETMKLYARALFSKFDDRESRNNFIFEIDDGSVAINAAGVGSGEAEGERAIRFRNEITQTTTLAVGGDFDFAGGLLTVQATKSLAKKDDPIRDAFTYQTDDDFDVNFVAGQRGFESVVVSAGGLDPDNYVLDSYETESRRAEEDLSQFRVDYKLPMDSWGDRSFFKIGAKYLDRDKFSDSQGAVFEPDFDRVLSDDATTSLPTTFGGKFSYGPNVDFATERAFFDANRADYELDEEGTLATSLAEDYRVTEKITAGYIMASITRGKLTVIPGVRVEHTEGETFATLVTSGMSADAATLAKPYDQFGSYEYTDYFPSINLKYQFSEQLLGRAALTTAIGRPNYLNLAPTVSIEGSGGGEEVVLGNPALLPQEAVNIDLSLEYYFPGEGGISLGLFHKKIDNPIFTGFEDDVDGTFGGVAVTNAEVTQVTNGNEATVSGLEFSYQQPFTFLPSPFDGLGINANVTLIDGELDIGAGRSENTSLPLQSDKLASVQLYYEKYNFSARVAYAYRSEYLVELGDDPEEDLYFDSVGSLSVKVGYKVTPKVEVFAEGNNLNNATDRYYYGDRSRLAEAEIFGTSYRFGISYTY